MCSCFLIYGLVSLSFHKMIAQILFVDHLILTVNKRPSLTWPFYHLQNNIVNVSLNIHDITKAGKNIVAISTYVAIYEPSDSNICYLEVLICGLMIYYR